MEPNSKDRQIYQMHKKGYEEISKAIKDKPEVQKVELIGAEIVTIKGQKGDAGYTPQKFKDYFTKEDQQQIVSDVMSKIRLPQDGKDGKDGKDGISPNVDYDKIEKFVKKEVSKIKIPVPKDGKDGKDAVLDYNSVIISVLDRIPEVNLEPIKKELWDEIRKIRETDSGRYRTLNSGGPTTRLGELVDVNVSGATDGQALVKRGDDFVFETISGGGGAVDSVNGQTGVVVLNADDIDDTSTTNKFVTATDITNLGNLSGINSGDQVADGVTITGTGTVGDPFVAVTGGSGDVVGPASSTDNAITRYDGITGKLIQDSLVTIDDVGVVSGVTQLNVDNIRIDGNTISTTDVNGDLILAPNGTGDVQMTTVHARTSAGLTVHNNSHQDVALFGPGGSQAVTFYDGVKLDGSTASRILSTDASKNITALDTATYPSLTELSYVKGLTSAAQTQINGKESTIAGSGTNTVWHGDKTFSAVVEADITLSDNTTNNVSTAKHGFMSKLPGGTTVFYRGDGTFATPAATTVPNAYVLQAFSNTSYNLIHNLGSYPVVQVLDSTGAVVIPLSIVNNTVNDLTVTFTTTGTYTIIATLGSPQLQKYVSTAVNYTAAVTDRIIEVTAAAKTITLPTANVSNVGYEYKIDNSSTGNIFVVGQGGETINKQPTQTIPPDSCLSIYANGTVWRID